MTLTQEQKRAKRNARLREMRALRRDGVYQPQPGWARHWMCLALACLAMVVVLLVGLWFWNDWTAWPTATRILRLSILMAAGGGSFMATLFASGFRLNDLRNA